MTLLRNKYDRFCTTAARPIRCRMLLPLAAVFFVVCDLFYEPQPQPDPLRGSNNPDDRQKNGVQGTQYGTIYTVNTGQQSCNPSIAPAGPFTGSLLFLGYDRLSVLAPDSLSAFSATQVATHDRLTVVDTSNTVRWYVLRSRIEPAGYFQCPEWSTHANYLSCLVGRIAKPHNGYALRLSDGQFLKLCSEKLEEFSYPHFWLPDSSAFADHVDSAAYYENGFAHRSAIEAFFGTSQFKYVYTLPSESGRLYFIDYTADGDPSPVPLDKPAGKENLACSSPLISPDGNWVAWHCFSNASTGSLYYSYIQELEAGSTPVLIAEGASDPHWWVDPLSGIYYIIYTVTRGDYFTEYDITDSSAINSMAYGCTLKQQLCGTWKKVPSHIGRLCVNRSVAPDTLLRLPFKGGMSDDGYFMGTAYKQAYIARLQ